LKLETDTTQKGIDKFHLTQTFAFEFFRKYQSKRDSISTIIM